MRSRQTDSTSLRIGIRPATRADLGALLELEQRVFATDRLSRRSLRRLIDSPTAKVLVASAGGRLVGTAVVLFRPRSTVARLYSIAVAPHMSGRGVGARLLVSIERLAVAGRCRCVRLEVHETNGPAISRYRKSGYEQFGRIAAYYEDGGDALRFEKPLVAHNARVIRERHR